MKFQLCYQITIKDQVMEHAVLKQTIQSYTTHMTYILNNSVQNLVNNGTYNFKN